MNPERWQQIKRLYNSALEIDPGRREAFLAEACAGDESLRKEIERLLARQAEAEDLLGKPALEVAARALAQDRKDEPQPNYVGRSLLHYRITEKIGEGGMGVVYKARDTHLDRTVAIKVLPAQAVADQERKRRFIQEAKAASALNHPNIIDIHDINSDAGVDFIVMEHVAGKTLDRRIGRKGLRIGETLKYAVQIADALAAAHAAGIVHRDLKPANIMVTETGLVKVLDFGLAKLTQPAQGEASGTVSPMQSLTGEGRIIGTVAYMSPEQAEGKAVDARSDIFSFGSVLYETLTGRQAFHGDSTISTLSAIIEKDPPPLNAEIPHDLERIITRCLRKDPARRFQAMSDLKVELEELNEAAESGRLKVGAAVEKRVSPVRLAVVFAVIALVAAGWYWLSRWRSAEPEAVLTPVPLTSYPGSEDSPSFSPDGTQVAFKWCTEEPSQNCDIYIKQVGVEPPFRLTTDPSEDFSPAWSPDGNSIAFLRTVSPSKAELRIIPQRGGHERLLGGLNPPYEPGPCLAWTPDSRWLAFPDMTGSGLFILSVRTGETRRLTEGGGDNCPAFSPDGRTLAFIKGYRYFRLLHLIGDCVPQGTSQQLSVIGPDHIGATWMPSGSEIVFSHGASGISNLWRMPASTSATPQRLPLGSDDCCYPAVSRHGNRLAYVVRNWDPNVWRISLSKPGLSHGTPVRLISSTRSESCPAYSPDGSKIAFMSDRSGVHTLWVCNGDGSNPMQLTTTGTSGIWPRWSPDGRTIAFAAEEGRYQYIYVISANGGIPQRLTGDPTNNDKWPYWSRDGQSIYFASWRDGADQICKVPAAGGKAVQITSGGVNRGMVQESPDGKFLYYEKGYPSQASLWRMPVGGGEETRILDAVHVSGGYRVRKEGIYFFTTPDERGHSDICLYDFATNKTTKILTIERTVIAYIDVSGDGRTILYTQEDQTGSDLMLVENFR
jgi:eukaryotic-like serine/threonine-protein kinase